MIMRRKHEWEVDMVTVLNRIRIGLCDAEIHTNEEMDDPYEMFSLQVDHFWPNGVTLTEADKHELSIASSRKANFDFNGKYIPHKKVHPRLGKAGFYEGLDDTTPSDESVLILETLNQLECGQSVFVSEKTCGKKHRFFTYLCRCIKYKEFEVRTVEGGKRIWRTK